MSTHNTQPNVTTRPRSSSVKGRSLYNSRPRSLGYYGGSSTSPYSSLYSQSSNPYSAISKYNSSNYQSPYFSNGSTGTSGSVGFASLKIPAKSLFNVNGITPNYCNTYNNNREYIRNDVGHTSRRDGTKVNRNRSLTRTRNSPAGSGMSSRSISLTSLNSEGYISGTDERNHRSRINSKTDIRSENGQIDYKVLYEQQLAENEKLKEKLTKSVEELRQTKQTLERINVSTSKNSLSELEKRKRRTMERKFSEMEEELKQLQKLKAENERLKADNRSLTRVINKLTSSK